MYNEVHNSCMKYNTYMRMPCDDFKLHTYICRYHQIRMASLYAKLFFVFDTNPTYPRLSILNLMAIPHLLLIGTDWALSYSHFFAVACATILDSFAFVTIDVCQECYIVALISSKSTYSCRIFLHLLLDSYCFAKA